VRGRGARKSNLTKYISLSAGGKGAPGSRQNRPPRGAAAKCEKEKGGLTSIGLIFYGWSRCETIFMRMESLRLVSFTLNECI